MHPPHWLALGGWVLGWLLFWRVPRVPRGGARRDGGPLTVVIPARNEALRLPVLLQALAPGLGEEERIVVVDDHSTDGTAEVARGFPHVTVLAAPDLPAGWTGKTWACHNGAAAAPPGELAFLDADVRLSAEALRDAVAQRRAGGGLLSIWPYHQVVRPYEHLSALFNLVSLMGTGAASVLPRRRPRQAFGPVVLTSTEDYRRVGGHESVRDQVVEDLALGRRYADAGLAVQIFGGGPDVSFRMYGDGLRGLVQGWIKSMGQGAFGLSYPHLLAVACWLACSIGALTWVGGLPNPKSFALMGLYALQMGVFFRRVGSFGVLDALLYPLHAVFLLGILVVSQFRAHVLRDVSWRGRSYGSQGARAPRP